MLIEMTDAAGLRHYTEGGKVFILVDGNYLMPAEDFFAEQRWLVDLPEAETEVVIETREEDPPADPGEDKPEELPPEEEQKREQEKPKRIRRSKYDIEQALLKLYNGGESGLSVAEIARQVGVSYKTARQYLPISEEG